MLKNLFLLTVALATCCAAVYAAELQVSEQPAADSMLELSSDVSDTASQLAMRRAGIARTIDESEQAGLITAARAAELRGRLMEIGQLQSQYQASGLLPGDQTKLINRQLEALSLQINDARMTPSIANAAVDPESLDVSAELVARNMRLARAQGQITQQEFDRLNLRLQMTRKEILKQLNHHELISRNSAELLSRELATIERRLHEAIATSPSAVWF